MPQTLQIEKSPYGDERADVKVSDKRFAVYFMEFCEDILLCALNIILMLFGLTLVNIRNHTPYDLLFAFEKFFREAHFLIHVSAIAPEFGMK